MKKWIIVAIVAAVAVLGATTWMQVSSNDSALGELESAEGVVVLAVSGMT